MTDRKSLLLLFVLVICASWTVIPNEQAYGQSGLRESLERLDTDGDGEIEPEEITPLARPYLERITRAGRMSIDRDNDIEELQEAARRYHAMQNGLYGKDIRPERNGTVRPFGPDEDEPLVPGFGVPKIKFPYKQEDLDQADRTLSSHDRDRNGFIDREEAIHERWTHRDPYEDDLDGDDRLSRMELVQRYARRRLLDEASDEIRRKDWRTGGEIRRVTRDDEQRSDSRWYREGGNSYWLTASVLGRFDKNKNGRLESQETQALGMPVAQIDTDRDGDISRQELQAFLGPMQEETGGLSEGIPGWFYELDSNRDRQVSMSEFATEWTDEAIQQFASLDINQDGLLTGEEVVRSKAMVGGSYMNRTAEVIPPGRTIISEIDVTEDYLIGDLNVRLSVTHSNVSYLDAYLTGPDGQRIELFTEVGGRDDNFEDTVFDDQSRYPINKARPPFKGTFMPEALVKRQPSLSSFNDKSVKGVWQLVIRATRSDRFGMLHSWGLLVKPRESMMDQPAAEPMVDGPQSTTNYPTASRAKPESPEETRGQSESRGESESRSRPDYAEIGRRMQAAVEAGEMTKDQVREAWAKIKSRDKAERMEDKGRGNERLSKEEAQERYRRYLESKSRKRSD